MNNKLLFLSLALITILALQTFADPNAFIFGFENNYSNWRDQTYGDPCHYSSGGNPDGYFASHNDVDPFFYPYDSAQAGSDFNHPLVGDLWSKYADDNNQMEYTVDIKVASPNVTITKIEYRLTGTNGNWRYHWYGSWTDDDSWITLKAPMDANDSSGWENYGTDSFYDTAASATKYAQLYAVEASNDVVLCIDNWGYSPGCTPYTPTSYAILSRAVAFWRMDSTADCVGGNSVLTTDGNTTVGNSLEINGPASNDYYANLPDHVDGDCLNAGQGDNNELQITGAHTFYIRVKFDDLSITQYLFSKYDHATGPDSSKHRTAYLRAEAGKLTYLVDDGDGGEAAVSAEVNTISASTWYDIAAVFDPDADEMRLYVFDPNESRTILFSDTSSVTAFDTIPMNCPVPFTIGDRLTWNGSSWVSCGSTAMNAKVEMAAIWDEALSEEALKNLVYPPQTCGVDIGFCMSTDWLKESTCYSEMPGWADHGINKLYVLHGTTPDLNDDLDMYDFIFDIGEVYGMKAYPGMKASMCDYNTYSTLITNIVNARESHPGYAGFAMPDEPVDIVNQPDFKNIAELVKQQDPNHPVWGNFTKCFVFHGDWVMVLDGAAVDTYAVGYNEPYWASTLHAKQIADMAETHGLDTADMLIQCCDIDGSREEISYPTLAENRYFSYGPLTVGCTGIYYYSLEYLSDETKLDDIIYPVVDEIRALEDVFDSDDAIPVVTTNCDSDTTDHGLNDITYLVKACDGKIYIIAVNNTASDKSVTFTLEGLAASDVNTVTALYESGRTLTFTRDPNDANNGSFTESTFVSYRAHVYEVNITPEPNYILSVDDVGASGSHVPSPNNVLYTPGTSVTLTATAGTGNVFVGWGTENTLDTNNPGSITMNYDKYLAAVFEPNRTNSFVFGFEAQRRWWMDNDYNEPNMFDTGGNPDGCVEIYSAGGSGPYLYPRCSIQGIENFSGDFGEKYGDTFNFTVDIQVDTPNVTLTDIRYVHLGGDDGDWRYHWSESITDGNGWVTLTAPFDVNWSDAQAGANGWTKNGSDSWIDTLNDVDGLFSYLHAYGYDPNTNGITVVIDNWGFITTE
ncbi:MAG: hypothetical protein ABIG61_05630 [Planctomycetota bacterium]